MRSADLFIGTFADEIAVLHWRQRCRAYEKVSNAIKSGKIQRANCEICGKPAIAHHEDYSKPLDITWLCYSHHNLRHYCIKTNDQTIYNK